MSTFMRQAVQVPVGAIAIDPTCDKEANGY
ncbi:UNVERIFIED_ORG: hypothetical protein J2W65_001754 [Pseudomonas parafulva]|nr:hypothetical protein [Pseudomonas parafulva]MDP9666222.1 hypothetical protein [Pseudomonas cremoricolorata]